MRVPIPVPDTHVPATRSQLESWDGHHVWHAFTQMAEYEPFLIERGEGCVLVDMDGRRYLDGVSSIWCNVHGHGHPRINAAIRTQLDLIAHCTALGASNPTTVRLAKRLVDITPDGLEHVFFSDDGATAVEVALKMAFQYWQQCPDPRRDKTKYMALGDAYHGDTLGDVSVGGVKRFRETFGPLLFEVHRLPLPTTYRLPAEVPPAQATEFYLQQAEELLSQRHSEIAAFILEPLVQCAAGMIVHPAGYLRGIRQLTQKYNVLLVADEVAVGMGRTGTMFACDQEGVVPDFLCLAKGLTGGYLPLAATLTSHDIFQAFLGPYEEQKTFCHGHTYGGNPLGAAAALATLDLFDEEDTLARLQPKIEMLAQRLARIGRLPHVGDVRQRGLIAGIELVQDRDTQTPFPWPEKRGARICDYARTRGVWLRPLGDVLVVVPPLAISIDELNVIMDAVEEGIGIATSDK